MPIFSDDPAAHRGHARLTSSLAHSYNSTRPGAEHSVHAASSQGFMPPAQIYPGLDVHAPHSRSSDVRLANVDPAVLHAAETLMIMRGGGTHRKQKLSQNRLPALPSVERGDRSKTPTPVTFPPSITMRTADIPRADSSRIRSSPYELLTPLSGFQPPPFRSPKAAYAQPPHMPIKQEPGSATEMPMSSLAPNCTLRPLIILNQSPHLNYPGLKVLPLYPSGPNGRRCNVLPTMCFKIGEHSIPLDKVKLAQMGYDDLELDVATAEILLTINWPGYPAEIGSIQRVVPAVQGTYTEVAIAYAVSTMVEELERRVFRTGATIEHKYHAFEVNKKISTRNLCITHLPHCFRNVYQPLLWIC